MMDGLKLYRCHHLSGLEVHAWLTDAEAWGAVDCWTEDRIEVYEDKDGEIIPHDVLLKDLEVINLV